MKRVVFAILVFIVAYGEASAQTKDSVEIYLIKRAWHTGILIEVNNYSLSKLPPLAPFKDCNFVDIGWGDLKFYQTPGFNLWYAAQAILFPTPSVARFRGLSDDIASYCLASDFAVRFAVSKSGFDSLCKYIDDSIIQYSGKYSLSSREKARNVIFYRSGLKYHLFFTCNTWSAKALDAAGIEVCGIFLITAEQLYDRIKSEGKVVKKSK